MLDPKDHILQVYKTDRSQGAKDRYKAYMQDVVSSAQKDQQYNPNSSAFLPLPDIVVQDFGRAVLEANGGAEDGMTSLVVTLFGDDDDDDDVKLLGVVPGDASTAAGASDFSSVYSANTATPIGAPKVLATGDLTHTNPDRGAGKKALARPKAKVKTGTGKPKPASDYAAAFVNSALVHEVWGEKGKKIHEQLGWAEVQKEMVSPGVCVVLYLRVRFVSSLCRSICFESVSFYLSVFDLFRVCVVRFVASLCRFISPWSICLHSQFDEKKCRIHYIRTDSNRRTGKLYRKLSPNARTTSYVLIEAPTNTSLVLLVLRKGIP